MKISLLSHDLSRNCLGRAYLLAKMLQKKHEVEIIGPTFGRTIWRPIKDDTSIRYAAVKNIKEAFSLIHGEILYAVKPKGTSFGYGLLKKLRSKSPLILDIDDWELGMFLGYKWNIFYTLPQFWNLNNVLYTFALEKLGKCADAITVSNSFLEKRFGGLVIPHARDTHHLHPDRYDAENLKRKYNLRDSKVVMHMGTIRKHKGIEDLIRAFNALNRKDAVLMLVGVDPNDSYIRNMMIYDEGNIRFIGEQPVALLPEFLSVADVVAVPQKHSAASVGQMPAKIYDAMAMAKPIISTKICDIAETLSGCGIVVDPGDIHALSKGIGYLLDNPDTAKELGRKAREKCVDKYSFTAIEPRLSGLIDTVWVQSKKHNLK
jgi:glycosyltransferase involved in cell wall biosynthesis